MFERIQAQVEQTRKRKEKRTEAAHEANLNKIRRGRSFIRDVQGRLDTHAANTDAKRRTMHADWSEHVFAKTMDAVSAAVDSRVSVVQC